jgi:hypothetical protein
MQVNKARAFDGILRGKASFGDFTSYIQKSKTKLEDSLGYKNEHMIN